VDIQDYLITYTEIGGDLTPIYPGHQLTLNLMAVCHSAESPIGASRKLTFDGENNDFRESLEIYPFNVDTIFQQIETINARPGRGNGLYHVVLE
jgi:hypothetical protein